MRPTPYRLTVPWSVADPGSFSLSCVPPQSSFARSTTLRLSTTGLPSRNFVPHRGIIRSRPLHTESPSSATFRPQAFSASRRFTPRPDAVSLFRLTTTSRVHAVQGLLPLCSSAAVTRDTSPLVVAAARTLRPRTASMPASPRLRGLKPHRDAFTDGLVSPSPLAAPLVGCFLLQVLRSSPMPWLPKAARS